MHWSKWGQRTREAKKLSKAAETKLGKVNEDLYSYSLGGLASIMSRHTIISFNSSHLDCPIFLSLCLFLFHSVLLPSPAPAPTVPQHCSDNKKKQWMDHLTFSGRRKKIRQNLKLPKNTGEKRGKWWLGHEEGEWEGWRVLIKGA